MWVNKKKKKSILIIGGFNEARSLANSLIEKDYRVTVVNKNYADCEKLAEINKMNVIYGDGSKKFILEDADAASCQVAIALTGSDETNLIICEMCKEFFHVEKTVSMLNDPSKTDFFYQMGIDRVVCALNMITNIMEENALMDEMMKMIPLEEGRLHIAETAILHNLLRQWRCHHPCQTVHQWKHAACLQWKPAAIHQAFRRTPSGRLPEWIPLQPYLIPPVSFYSLFCILLSFLQECFSSFFKFSFFDLSLLSTRN